MILTGGQFMDSNQEPHISIGMILLENRKTEAKTIEKKPNSKDL